jgi:hypothetical protein
MGSVRLRGAADLSSDGISHSPDPNVYRELCLSMALVDYIIENNQHFGLVTA